MIKQNKIKLHFILGVVLATVAVTGCNDSSDSKSVTKDATTITTQPPAAKDSTDTMEVITGKKAPGNDVKPQ